MLCSACGCLNEDNEGICKQCGAPLHVSVPPPMSTPPQMPPQISFPPPVPPPGPVNLPPIPAANFADQLVRLGPLFGFILLGLSLFPWGINVFLKIPTSQWLYSRPFIYLDKANFTLITLLKPKYALGHINPWDLMHYLLIFIPLAVITLFLWKTRRKVYPVLTLILALLSAIEVGRSLISELVYPAKPIFTVLNLFEWLTLIFLILVAVFALVLLAVKPSCRFETRKLNPLIGWITWLGMAAFVLFHMPLAVIDRSNLFNTASIFTLFGNLFMLPQLLIWNIKAVSHDLPLKIIIGVPLWGQLLLFIFTMLALSGLAASIIALLIGTKRKNLAVGLVITSALGFVMLPIRLFFAPIDRPLINGMPLTLKVMQSVSHNVEYTVFYYLLIIILVVLLILGIVHLSRKNA